MSKTDIGSMTYDEIQNWVLLQGWPAFRGRQIFSWLHKKAAESFGQMSDLSKDLRTRLEDLAGLDKVEIIEVQRAEDQTEKYRYRLRDNAEVEGVLMPDQAGAARTRTTLCVSTQVGCAMGCAFCATAGMGFIRNLTASEIVGQLEAVKRRMGHPQGPSISNVVFMGMGEPLANLDSVVKAVEILLHPMGHGMSRRKITVSTVGLPAAMEQFVHRVPVKLAVSLNATTDAVRDRIMPVNKRFPLRELLDCCKNLPLMHTDRITFEYVLLAGVNDSAKDADRLKKLLKGIRCKINLIPYNSITDGGYTTPPEQAVEEFKERLAAGSLSVFIRKSRGVDLRGACGQLVTMRKKRSLTCSESS